jgi:hypothetical protein
MGKRKECKQDDCFGLCPVCHKNDGYVNAGKTHVFYCKEHRVSWIAGTNLFSSWKQETEEEQRAIYNEIGIGEFERIEWPFFWPVPKRADAAE